MLRLTKEEKHRSWILSALKQRIKESTDKEIIQDIVQSIAERRINDLQDILITLEQTEGWQSAIHYLRESSTSHYFSNIGLNGPRKEIEPIKYREVLFDVLGYGGLDSANISTIELLDFLEAKNSFTQALTALEDIILSSIRTQIMNDDTFFLNLERASTSLPTGLHDQVITIRDQELKNSIFIQDDTKLVISGLWHTEYGHHALSRLGLNKNEVSKQQIDVVLSVLPVSDMIKKQIIGETPPSNGMEYKEPNHPLYRELLTSLIEGNVSSLRDLGSRCAIGFFSMLLETALDTYKTNPSSENFRTILSCINNLVSVRALDSLTVLDSLANSNDVRLVTPAISALGNFYHLSSIDILVNIVCNRNNPASVDAALKAIENIHKRCPQFEYVIRDHLQYNCHNRAKLQNLYRRIARRSDKRLYYE